MTDEMAALLIKELEALRLEMRAASGQNSRPDSPQLHSQADQLSSGVARLLDDTAAGHRQNERINRIQRYSLPQEDRDRPIREDDKPKWHMPQVMSNTGDPELGERK